MSQMNLKSVPGLTCSGCSIFFALESGVGFVLNSLVRASLWFYKDSYEEDSEEEKCVTSCCLRLLKYVENILVCFHQNAEQGIRRRE